MAEYYVGAVSPGANSAEIWRRGEGGNPDDRINLCSLDISGTNRGLDFTINGDVVAVTDHWDPGYKLVFNLAGARHNDQLSPM